MSWETAKPALEKSINAILHKAALAAQLSTITDNSTGDPAADAYIDQCTQKFSEEWAKKFADEASGPLADAIYTFAKSVEIVMTPTSQGLVIPMAPSPIPLQGFGSTTGGDFKVM